MFIETINPATGNVIQKYPEMPNKTIVKIIDSTYSAFLQWRESDFSKRAHPMYRLAEILRQRKKEYTILMANEMGKPIAQGEAELEKCAMVCEYYASNAEHYLKPRQVTTEMSKSYINYQPLGIIFAIMPWNFPFWQVFRFAAPTLMAGNGALLKHAPICTGIALAI